MRQIDAISPVNRVLRRRAATGDDLPKTRSCVAPRTRDDTPENKKFVEGYTKRFNARPGPYPYLAYVGAKAMIQAIKDAGGKVEDKEAVAAALRKVKVAGPMGTVTFDDRQGMVGDPYYLKVVRNKAGVLENQCLDKIPQSKDPYNLFP